MSTNKFCNERKSGGKNGKMKYRRFFLFRAYGAVARMVQSRVWYSRAYGTVAVSTFPILDYFLKHLKVFTRLKVEG